MNKFIEVLASSLAPATRREFGPVERILLERSMELCGMDEYPSPVGDPAGERAYGDCICYKCNKPYLPIPWIGV